MFMKNPLKFFVELMQQPAWIPIWVTILIVVNFVSIGFGEQSLARVIFATFMLSAMLMMGLYSRFGFKKILGMGHILWLPLLIYVLCTIPFTLGTFKDYLIVWSIFTFISLVFDVIDVWKYFITRNII